MTFRSTIGCATNCASAPWVSGPQSVSALELCVCMAFFVLLGAGDGNRTPSSDYKTAALPLSYTGELFAGRLMAAAWGASPGAYLWFTPGKRSTRDNIARMGERPHGDRLGRRGGLCRGAFHGVNSRSAKKKRTRVVYTRSQRSSRGLCEFSWIGGRVSNPVLHVQSVKS